LAAKNRCFFFLPSPMF